MFFGSSCAEDSVVVEDLRRFLVKSDAIKSATVLEKINIPETIRKTSKNIRNFQARITKHTHICVCNHGVLLANNIGGLAAKFGKSKFPSIVSVPIALEMLQMCIAPTNTNPASIFFDSCWAAAHVSSVNDGCWAAYMYNGIPVGGHVNDPRGDVSLQAMIKFWNSL